MAGVTNQAVRPFWEQHPVAAAGIGAEPGTPAFFAEFDLIHRPWKSAHEHEFVW